MSRSVIEVDPQKFPWLDIRSYTFSMAAENQGIVYLAGQSASEYDPAQGRVVCKGDLIDQTKLIFEKLGVVLEAAGLTFDNVVKTVDYVYPVGLPQYRQTGEVRRQYLKSTPVASTGICVERLLRPDALIEISAVAVREPKRAVNPGWDQYQQLTYAPGVLAGDTLWLSGFVGYEEREGVRHYPQDTNLQVGLSYGIINEILKAAGAQPSDVIHSFDYVAPQALLQYPNSAQARRQFFGAQYPAGTSVMVNRLLRPEGHVEVETVAVTGGEREEIQIPEWGEGSGDETCYPAVKKGRLLFISGQEGIDHASGQSESPYDIVAQTDRAYSNIAQVLAAGGYSMDDVVNTIEWVPPNGLMSYRHVQEVRRKHFGDTFPSATGVVIHRLSRPELLIQVTAVAVV